MNRNLQEHWNLIYNKTPVERLGWYEIEPEPSLTLIKRCKLPHNLPVIDVGCGVSSLITRLLNLGYEDLYALDISPVALDISRKTIRVEDANKVHWLLEDVTQSQALPDLMGVGLWHDRAVFHFLTNKADRQAYYTLLSRLLMPGGWLVMATFSLAGAEMCSGLPVQRYNADTLFKFLGEEFSPVDSLEYSYRMPSGDRRPFLYARFRKKSA